MIQRSELSLTFISFIAVEFNVATLLCVIPHDVLVLGENTIKCQK